MSAEVWPHHRMRWLEVPAAHGQFHTAMQCQQQLKQPEGPFQIAAHECQLQMLQMPATDGTDAA